MSCSGGNSSGNSSGYSTSDSSNSDPTSSKTSRSLLVPCPVNTNNSLLFFTFSTDSSKNTRLVSSSSSLEISSSNSSNTSASSGFSKSELSPDSINIDNSSLSFILLMNSFRDNKLSDSAFSSVSLSLCSGFSETKEFTLGWLSSISSGVKQESSIIMLFPSTPNTISSSILSTST